MSSTHRLTRGSVRRALALSAAGAMVFALTPVQSAFAQAEPGARDIQEAGDPCVEHQDGTEAFDDINNENIDFAAECLNDLNIARGYGDNEYRPTQFVNREQMASFISRKLESAVEYNRPDDAPEANFTDREQIAQVHVNNVDILASLGIVEGFEDNTYRPGAAVTRGQMASFIVREMEEITGQELTASQDYFEDDNGTTHEANINVVAEHGIAEGTGDGFEPHASVTRGQMALFIARNIDALNNEFGITFEPVVEGEPAPTTNQTFAVTPAEDQTVEEGGRVEFTAADITADEVVIALVECDNVTTDADGNVVFVQDETVTTQTVADFGTVAADITEVNGVIVTDGGQLVTATVTDGTVTFAVQGDANVEECFVAVVFEDADADELLDIDAEGLPTELFGVPGAVTFATVAGLNASPEDDLNRFATDHTVTAQLVTDTTTAGERDPAPVAGETIRFQVFRGAEATVDPTTGEVTGCTGGTVVATGTGTTDENGQAAFTYTGPNDPTTGDDQRVTDCVLVFHDADNDGILDDGEFQDTVRKQWDDVSTVNTLELEPETDTNAVGTAHTVAATFTDEFGDPIADQAVTFEVWRDIDAETTDTGFNRVILTTRTTNTTGVATLSYTGPTVSADDVIVACIEEANNETTGDTDSECNVVITDIDTVFVDDEPNDVAVKYWVETATADTGDVTDACVIGFDKDNNVVDVEDADQNLRLAYDAGDQYIVSGSPNTMEAFETNLTLGDRLTVEYNPGGVSQFTLVDDTDCTA